MTIVGMAVFALLAQNAVLQPIPSTSIQGIVVRAGTTAPLSRVTVELRGDGNNAPPLSSTTTEGDGRFVFYNVQPGRYRLVAVRPGYVRLPSTVTLTAGQQITDIRVAMTPTGAIYGSVYDDKGEPLANVEVRALRASYQEGRRVLTVAQSVRTNDLGEYRLFWLPPGRYFVSAVHPDALSPRVLARPGGRGAPAPGDLFHGAAGDAPGPGRGGAAGRGGGAYRFSGGFEFSGGGGGPNGPIFVRGSADEAVAVYATDSQTGHYIPVYFPGTIDEQAASAINLGAGAEFGGVNFVVAPVSERRVRGVVINGSSRQPAQYAQLRTSVDFDPSRTLDVDPESGTFDVALLPGPYTLVATAGTGIGYASIQIGDSDVDDVSIVTMSPLKIPGRIIIEGRPGDNLELGQLRVSLRRDPAISAASPSSYSIPFPNGTFTVEGTAGDYRVNLAPILNVGPASPGPPFGLPRTLQDAYVKSIRLGGADVLNDGLHLEGPPGSPLEIVLDTNPGTVEGSIVNERQEPVSDVSVVLVPDVRRRTELYRVEPTDPSGRFHFDRVPPGAYKIFAWAHVESGRWHDADFMRASEGRGTPIRIGEGRTETVQVTVIAP